MNNFHNAKVFLFFISILENVNSPSSIFEISGAYDNVLLIADNEYDDLQSCISPIFEIQRILIPKSRVDKQCF